MQTQLTASRLMRYAAAASNGANRSPFPDPALAAQAKSLASEAAIKIVNDALQMFGTRGCSRDFTIERMVHDERLFTISGGIAQALRNPVACKVLGWKLPQSPDGYSAKPVSGARDVQALRGCPSPLRGPPTVDSSS